MTRDSTDPAGHVAVAIVDDEALVRVSLRRLCNAFGLSATAYGSARDFLDSLNGTLPDCLLLDIQMPEMTGLELQRHLASIGVQIPTIVVTADDAPEARARCLAAGAVEYLRKPIGADELFAAIERAVSHNKRPKPSPPRGQVSVS